MQQPHTGLLCLVSPLQYSFQIISLNHVSEYIKILRWLLAACWTKSKYLLNVVYKAFHSLLPVCLASLIFGSSPIHPSFYPHQITCSFLNMPHSHSPVPLLIIGHPLNQPYSLLTPRTAYSLLCHLWSLAWFPSSTLFIPHRINCLYSLLSQFHVHISVLSFLLLLYSTFAHCLHICYSLRLCLTYFYTV